MPAPFPTLPHVPLHQAGPMSPLGQNTAACKLEVARACGWYVKGGQGCGLCSSTRGVSANPPESQLPLERMPSPNLAWVLGAGLPILLPSSTPVTREFCTWLLPTALLRAETAAFTLCYLPAQVLSGTQCMAPARFNPLGK